jgi:ATP-dependent exoDNAse (exonuclease V) beta subunit
LEIASALDVGEQTPQAVMAHFQRAIASPAVRQILSRGAYASLLGEGVLLRVRREHPFAVRDTDDDGAPWLLTGVFDRLVTGETASGAAWAEIVDFKSDAIDPDDMFSIGERLAYYRPQMESYARAAARVLRLEPDRVTAKLVFTSCDRVERVV